MSVVFWHPTLPDRRVPTTFSFGAFCFGSLWAWSEGIVKTAGRLYVFDALVVAISVEIFFLLNESDAAMFFAFGACFSWRIYVGYKAKSWLLRHLLGIGYKSATAQPA